MSGSFPSCLTKKERKALKRRYASVIGGGESFPNSGNFLGPLGESLEFPDPSIMSYVVFHNSSSAPLSKEDLQKLILNAKIFFTQQDIEQYASSIEFYRKKHELDEPQTELDSFFLKIIQEQNAAAATRLAKLQSEAKAAEASEASVRSKGF